MRAPSFARALGPLVALGGLLAGACNSPSIPACSATPDAQPEYVLVEYRYGGQYGQAPQVEIKTTPQYAEKHASLKSAAIRFPDSCLNESAAKVTGLSDNSQTIMQTTCLPWLGEIEKALVGAGYRVISSDALYKLEKQKNLSPYNAGKELGAEVVFILNSLDAGDIVGGTSTQGKFRYFDSDASGAALAPKALDEHDRAFFKTAAQVGLRLVTKGQDEQAVLALSSIIDTIAVLTETGESIWYYTRTVTVPTSEKRGMKFLFGRYPGETFRPLAPTQAELEAVNMEPTSTLSTEDTVETSSGPARDPYQKKRLELIRAGAAELVRSFQGGAR
jgi:hypothetical protein